MIAGLPAFNNRHHLYFIDAHSQISEAGLEATIIEKMAANHVCHTLLSGRSSAYPPVTADIAARHPREITAAVRSKGGAYIVYTGGAVAAYESLVNGQLSSGDYRALGETMIYHAPKPGLGAPEVQVFFDDPRVTLILNAARRNNWPMILHIEFASSDWSDADKRYFMSGLESFLNANPDVNFPINHMGQLPAAEVRRLIEAHPNIYFMPAHSNPLSVFHSDQPWVNMFSGFVLKPERKALFIAHPDRFIFAMDNVTPRHWNTRLSLEIGAREDRYNLTMRYWMSAMNDLPRAVAHKFAHGNAEDLWTFQTDRRCRGDINIIDIPARERLPVKVPVIKPPRISLPEDSKINIKKPDTKQ